MSKFEAIYSISKEGSSRLCIGSFLYIMKMFLSRLIWFISCVEMEGW